MVWFHVSDRPPLAPGGASKIWHLHLLPYCRRKTLAGRDKRKYYAQRAARCPPGATLSSRPDSTGRETCGASRGRGRVLVTLTVFGPVGAPLGPMRYGIEKIDHRPGCVPSTPCLVLSPTAGNQAAAPERALKATAAQRAGSVKRWRVVPAQPQATGAIISSAIHGISSTITVMSSR